MSPVRIQLSRARGWRMPPGTVKVDRTTPWGNPWIPGDPGRVVLRGLEGPMKLPLPMAITLAGALDRFRRWCLGEFEAPDGSMRLNHPIYEAVISDPKPDLRPLRGWNLACWCALDRPCHADILLELANR